jgi:uncharacterized protein YdaU (DUF1376 family)
MATDHYLPWFVGDFMASTATWTGPERGLYIQLLGCQWSAGSLPADLPRLARAVNYELPEFLALWPTVAPKFKNGDGRYTNLRLEEIRAKNEALNAARSAKAKVAADARWHAPSNAQAMQTHPPSICSTMPSDPIRSESGTEPKPTKNTSARKRARESEEPEGFAEFRKTFPIRAGSQPWQRAVKCWRARISEGASVSEILAGARRYAAYISATGKERTDMVLQAATFLGPDRHYQNLYPAPKAAESAWDEIQRATGGSSNGSGRVFEGTESDRPALASPFGFIRGGGS